MRSFKFLVLGFLGLAISVSGIGCASSIGHKDPAAAGDQAFGAPVQVLDKTSLTLVDNTSGSKDTLARDLAVAAGYYQQAADRDYPPAMLRLGRLWRDGEAGEPDAEAATYWLAKAAERGLAGP